MLPKRNSIGGLIALTVAVFSPALVAKFVFFDDDLHIFRNNNLALPLSESLKVIWLDAYRGFYIPVTYTAWTLLTQLTKVLVPFKSLETMPAFFFHAFNLVLHLANTLLLFGLLRRTISNPKAVLCAAFLFALHPVQVESVAWATGLKDLLSTFFCLLAVWIVLRFHSKNWLLTGAFSTLFFVAALFSKPSSVVLPFLALSFFYFLKRDQFLKTFPLFLFWAFLIVPFGLLTKKLQPQSLLLDYTPLYFRPLIALDALMFYLGKLLLPIGLVIDYSRNPQFVINHAASYFGVLGLVGATMYFWWKKYLLAINFIVLFGLSIFPVMGLVPFSFQNFSTVADHYLYLPMLVVATFLAVSLTRLSLKSQYLYGCGALLVVLSFWQCTLWTTTERLMEYTLSINPKSTLAHNNLAVEYESRKQLEKALYHYREATKFNSRLNHHHYNVGNILLKQGKLKEAEEAFYTTLRVDPEFAEAYFSLGLIEEAAKNYSKALQYFQTAIEMDPKLGKAAIKMGTTWVKQGNIDRGIQQIAQSIELDQRVSVQGFYHLGRAYLLKNDLPKAREAFEQSLTLNPKYEAALAELERLKQK